jgi:hypothetical protein
MIQVYSEDPSNVKSYRTGLRHLTRAEADIEFALDASGYGQDATTGWAMAKSQHGIDLAVVTQPEDFPKQPWQAWQRRTAYQTRTSLGRVVGTFVSLREVRRFDGVLAAQPPR